jgi:hypothetical protein
MNSSDEEFITKCAHLVMNSGNDGTATFFFPDEDFSKRNPGGGERDRTDDLLLAKQALSQLSYTPDVNWWVWLDLNQRPHAYQACALTN